MSLVRTLQARELRPVDFLEFVSFSLLVLWSLVIFPGKKFPSLTCGKVKSVFLFPVSEKLLGNYKPKSNTNKVGTQGDGMKVWQC